MASAKMPTLDCAVDCWNGNVTAPPTEPSDDQPVPPIEAVLKQHGKEYAFHRYDGAGHAFFSWQNE